MSRIEASEPLHLSVKTASTWLGDCVLFHDPELMLKVYRMVQAGFSYRQAALSLDITKDKVAGIMRTFKLGRAQVSGNTVVQAVPPSSGRVSQRARGYGEGYRACLADLLKAANDVLSLAREKWPNVFNEEESRRMLSFVRDVYAALEVRATKS